MNNALLTLCVVLAFCIGCDAKLHDEFNELYASPDWQLKFSDACTEDWPSNWFLDGEFARVKYGPTGMDLRAGPVHRNDAHHAVLWTKQSFEGDVKIEYEYTRTDSRLVDVNVVLIQATGLGTEAFDEDIAQWNEYRRVPTMSKYWLNMNALHVSVAAFPGTNADPDNDYLRARRYPAPSKSEFSATEVPPTSLKTGLFRTGVTYRMRWIKWGTRLLLHVACKGVSKSYEWDFAKFAPVTEGRIGLRHMYGRSASYRNFRVWTRPR